MKFLPAGAAPIIRPHRNDS